MNNNKGHSVLKPSSPEEGKKQSNSAVRTLKDVSRRRLLIAGAALPMAAVITRRAYAASFSLKLADGMNPNHPVNLRVAQAAKAIEEKTDGAIRLRIFPNAELGSDPNILTQARSGGVDFVCMGSDVLTTLVPSMGILNLGFAFANYDQVWKAMDGKLGAYLAAETSKVGLTQVGRSWDNGFRQITTATRPITSPESLAGFKIRVPPAPMLTSLFQALGASPTPVDFNELYSALQTHLVDGEENALPVIATAKLYEVQKYCSLTNHSWDAYLMLANTAKLEKLPAKYRDVITQEFNKAALEERQDIVDLNASIKKQLADKLTFNTTSQVPFREKLLKTSYYNSWRAKFGDQAWSLLEDVVGKIG